MWRGITFRVHIGLVSFSILVTIFEEEIKINKNLFTPRFQWKWLLESREYLSLIRALGSF